MGIFGRRGIGAVVIARFPFSDLSQAELRPAVVIARPSREDWLLCQVTTNRYADSNALELNTDSFASGGLRLTSYARPGKLFTSNDSLITREVGTLRQSIFNRLIDAVIDLLNQSRRA